MDALILSCGTGGGHNSAGCAVAEELRRRGHNVTMFTPYTLQSDRLTNIIDKTYITIAQKTPNLFGLIYRIGNAYRKLPCRSPVYFANRKMADVLQKYLAENHFDVIIMSHLFPAEILTNMKDKGMDVPKTIFVATDYTCTPFTEETKCDAFVLPSADLIDEFAFSGIPSDKLYPFGIPSHSSFSADMTETQAKEQLGLDVTKQYILVSGGRICAGKIDKTIDSLYSRFSSDSNIRLIVICGNNRSLYDKLIQKYGDNIITIERTDKMAAYIKSSSLFLTKPGGLSSTEAAVSGVPTVHISPIPGCETVNARFFESRGMSIYCRSPHKNIEAVISLMNDSKTRDEMVKNQQKYINPSASKDICDLAEKMIKHDL